MSEENPNTGNDKDIYARAPAKRKITESTIEAVAALVSRGMTTTEACHQMNVRPKTFFNFTSSHRNDLRFNELLERFTAMRVDDLLAEIEKSAHGTGMKMRDWRAAKFLLEVLDRKRFNTDKPLIDITVPGAPLDLRDFQRALSVFMQCRRSREQPAIDVTPAEPKQISNAKP